MEVVVDSVLLVNIYAPNDRHEREHLFGQMRQWPWSQLEVVLFSNFNCVQSPHLDRLGGLRSGRPESPELETLLRVLGLEDAHTLAQSTMEDTSIGAGDRPAGLIVSMSARYGQRSSSRFIYNCR